MRIALDRSICVSSGNCVAAAADAFALGDDLVAMLLPGAERLSAEEITHLVAACPSGALSVDDEPREVERSGP